MVILVGLLALTLASCALFTLAVELCIWQRYNENNLANSIVTGYPLGRRSIVIDRLPIG